MRSRSQQLPLCPHCQCPTPAGELERWQMCSICATKHWRG
jgi:predicted nucleic acid-binding Zn ribbon protein